MSRRRRWLLGTAVAFVACVLVVWSIVAPGGRIAVSVVYIGYTNVPTTYSYGGRTIASTMPMALVMVTNTGSVAVKVFPEIRADIVANTNNFALPYLGSKPPLRPGEAVVFHVFVPDPRRAWWTELAYCRYELGMRMHDRLEGSGSAVVQGMLTHLAPLPEKQWARSGWITHLPPPTRIWETADGTVIWHASDAIDATKPRRRYHINAPPPDWKEIDWQGINPSAPASRPLQ